MLASSAPPTKNSSSIVHSLALLGACLSISREPRWQGEGADARRAAPPVVVPRASRATPQTPLSLPTLRDRADFPSCGVVASLLGIDPIASAPPCLRGNLPRSRPREILIQAPTEECRSECCLGCAATLRPCPNWTVRCSRRSSRSTHNRPADA